MLPDAAVQCQHACSDISSTLTRFQPCLCSTFQTPQAYVCFTTCEAQDEEEVLAYAHGRHAEAEQCALHVNYAVIQETHFLNAVSGKC